MSNDRMPVSLVDCDVHPSPRSADELFEYVPDECRGRWMNAYRMRASSAMYVPASGGPRTDARPPDGSPAGSDPELLEEQLLRAAGVDIAILLPLGSGGTPTNPDHGNAIRRAVNRWLADRWLSRYPERLRGSIYLSMLSPELAAEEITRWADDSRFVQALIDPYEVAPLGQRQYRPVLAAAAQHDMPIALHINRTPGMALLSPVGIGAYYSEIHPAYAMPSANHLTSLIIEGVFDLFPTLKVVLVEGGLAWVAPLLWRLDRYYEEFPGDVELERRPSEYLRSNVRVTTQPIEEPDDRRLLHDYLRWMHAEETVLFSSDYPHWDFDNPRHAIARLPREHRDAITHGNAIELYRLPSEIPTTALVR
jgi:uncharacterized protein